MISLLETQQIESEHIFVGTQYSDVLPSFNVDLHSLLFQPLPNQGTLEPDPGTTFEILDRVVVVKMGYSVPFGRRGTVVGIHPGESPSDTLYDVIFDEEFVGGIALRFVCWLGVGSFLFSFAPFLTLSVAVVFFSFECCLFLCT